jgi:NAD(P)-dependent dehydrogenase (short-subunit alcohol dehydrogenase family)
MLDRDTFAAMALPTSMRAVVTGAGSGLGRAFCLELGRRGARVVASDIDLESAEETAQACGGQAVRCDVSRLAEVEALANDVDRLLGGVDLLINNAGVAVIGPIDEIPPQDWQWLLGVNLWGVVHGIQVFAPRMRKKKSGYVINVASAAGFAGVEFMGPYCASKAAVISLSETLAAEGEAQGIGVTVLCPTFFPTNIARSGRGYGQSSERLRAFAQERVARGKWSAEDVARFALDAADAGRLYAVPMSDARWLWRFKRFMPERFVRMSTRVVRSQFRKHGVTVER